MNCECAFFGRSVAAGAPPPEDLICGAPAEYLIKGMGGKSLACAAHIVYYQEHDGYEITKVSGK